MQRTLSVASSSAANVMTMAVAELRSLVQSQAETITALTYQLDWFRRQIFGQKSERFIVDPGSGQRVLGEVLPVPEQGRAERKTIPSHTRRLATREAGEEIQFFDESKVPVQTMC